MGTRSLGGTYFLHFLQYISPRCRNGVEPLKVMKKFSRTPPARLCLNIFISTHFFFLALELGLGYFSAFEGNPWGQCKLKGKENRSQCSLLY